MEKSGNVRKQQVKDEGVSDENSPEDLTRVLGQAPENL